MSQNWVDCFTCKLVDKVKICGICLGYELPSNWQVHQIFNKHYSFVPKDDQHIQSMVFCLDREGLDVLISYGLFKNRKEFPVDKVELILSCEVAMSSILRREGFSMYSHYVNQGGG